MALEPILVTTLLLTHLAVPSQLLQPLRLDSVGYGLWCQKFVLPHPLPCDDRRETTSKSDRPSSEIDASGREREKEKTHTHTHTHEKTATEETRRTQNPNARKPQHKRQEELKTLKLETDLRQVEEGEAHPDCFRSNSSKLPSKSWMPQNNRDPMTHYPDPSSNHAQILHQIMWRGKCVTKDQIYKTLILNSLACRSISWLYSPEDYSENYLSIGVPQCGG
jgi:hypothetical protein